MRAQKHCLEEVRKECERADQGQRGWLLDQAQRRVGRPGDSGRTQQATGQELDQIR
jgi:hypothetical protein